MRDDYKPSPTALRNEAAALRIAAAERLARAKQFEDEAFALENPINETAMARPICTMPCGKRRFDSEARARRAQKSNSHRMRAYFSAPCGCWHATKVEVKR